MFFIIVLFSFFHMIKSLTLGVDVELDGGVICLTAFTADTNKENQKPVSEERSEEREKSWIYFRFECNRGGELCTVVNRSTLKYSSSVMSCIVKCSTSIPIC